MAQTKRKKTGKKRKGRVKLTQRVRLVEKNDATSVAKPAITQRLLLKSYVPDNGATFKIRIRRK